MGLMAAPASAAPTSNSTDNPGTSHRPAVTPSATTNPGVQHRPAPVGPNASLPAKARAYGVHCKGESRKRSDAAPGTRGTPYSQCVTAMAKLATGRVSNPRTACAGLSKKRSDAGPDTRGTPYSQCVVRGARLLRQQRAQS